MNPYLPGLVVNLAPAVSVLLLGWDAFPLLLLYWLENLVIGGVTLGKMLAAGMARGVGKAVASLFLATFFVVHYGLFCAAHGGILWEVFGGSDGDARHLVPGTVLFVAGNPLLAANLALFAAWHLHDFIAGWLMSGRHRTAGPNLLMFAPYGRIVVIHVALLFGGLALSVLGEPAIAVALLALLKLALEFVLWSPRTDAPAHAAAGS